MQDNIKHAAEAIINFANEYLKGNLDEQVFVANLGDYADYCSEEWENGKRTST